MNRIYVQLGRAGDAMSVLPILWSDAQSGQRATLMIHRDYAGLLDGVGYCDRFVWEGAPGDINGALAEARKHSNEVRCCQIVGDSQAVKEVYLRSGSQGATTDSFQKESWRVCGRLPLWKEQPPLIFDKRDKERERRLLGKLGHSRNKKYLLVALDSKTSPFPYKAVLSELIHLKFKAGFIVVDLSEYKAERIYDLLAIYEKAWALIAVDSALLHLAQACPKLPVAVLAQDKPTLWHGSAWRPQYISYIRYSDFPSRAVSMLRALDNIQSPSSYFVKGNGHGRIVHVYHTYEFSPDVRAKETWDREAHSGEWIDTQVETGALGHDSKRKLKDEKRVPFLKDVLRLGVMRAGDNDLICLTRPDTCFSEGLAEKLKEAAPCFSRRIVVQDGEKTYHPAVDLFAFSKQWWREHHKEIPDFVMGRDPHWHRVLMEIMKATGAKEIRDGAYQLKETA